MKGVSFPRYIFCLVLIWAIILQDRVNGDYINFLGFAKCVSSALDSLHL